MCVEIGDTTTGDNSTQSGRSPRRFLRPYLASVLYRGVEYVVGMGWLEITDPDNPVAVDYLELAKIRKHCQWEVSDGDRPHNLNLQIDWPGRQNT